MEFKLLIENAGLDHIALKIFSNLNPSSLANCRLVAKSWSNLLTRSPIWLEAKADGFEAICNNPNRPNAQWNFERWKLWKDAIQALKNKDRIQFRKLIDFLDSHCQLDKASDSPYHDFEQRECLFEALRGLESLLEENEQELVDTLLKYLPSKHVCSPNFPPNFQVEDKPDLSLLCFFAAAKSLSNLFLFLLNKTTQNGVNVFLEIRNEHGQNVYGDPIYITYAHRLCTLGSIGNRLCRTFLQKLMLYCAIEMPSIEMLDLITKHMPQDEWRFTTGTDTDRTQTLLHDVCYHRPPDHMTNRSITDLINYILEHSGIDINSRNRYNMTPLHLACRDTGSLSAAKALLAHPDIDIHLVNTAGNNAFDMACSHGLLEIAKILCSMDNTLASRENEFRNGYTPLHYTIETMKWRAYKDPSFFRLVEWMQWKHFDVVKYLLSQPNVDINAQGSDGISPLHIACKYDSMDYEPSKRETIEFLLSQPDIQVNVRDASNATPLHLACRLGSHYSKHKEIVAAKALLRAKGIDVNAKDSSGKTAKDYAMEALDDFNDNIEMIQKVQELIGLLDNYESFFQE